LPPHALALREGHFFRRRNVIALLVLGALVFAGMLVIGTLAAVVGLLGFVISLPFRILGWTFKLLGLLLAIPFALIGLMLGGVGLAVGLGFALLPALPFIALVWLCWWLFAGRGKSAPQGSHASVIS
jgi:hypothetical protein